MPAVINYDHAKITFVSFNHGDNGKVAFNLKVFSLYHKMSIWIVNQVMFPGIERSGGYHPKFACT